MSRYRVKIRGQFEYVTCQDADSPKEAQDYGELDLEHEMADLEVVIINSVQVEPVDNTEQQRGEGEE